MAALILLEITALAFTVRPIESVLNDGRGLECTAVADSEVGVLGERGWLR